MSHNQQNEFISLIKQHFPDFFQGKKVLEVGSLDINGSIRKFFTDCDYTGVDLEIGKGVDLAVPGQFVDLPSKSFDFTISCECFEHNPFWQETFINMLRMTKPGGLVVMSCACYGRAEHGTNNSFPDSSPFTINQGWEYYRNLSSIDFEQKLELNNWFSNYKFCYNYKSYDLYFIGVIKTSENSKNYLPEINAIAEQYKTDKNITYQRLCSFGQDFFKLVGYRVLNPGKGTYSRIAKMFNK